MAAPSPRSRRSVGRLRDPAHAPRIAMGRCASTPRTPDRPKTHSRTACTACSRRTALAHRRSAGPPSSSQCMPRAAAITSGDIPIPKANQSLSTARTAWTPCSIRRQHCAMPTDLTDYELETAARACRGLAHREQQSAKTISDPSLREPVHKRARCAAALVAKFEAARRALRAGLGSSPSPDRTPLAW